MNEPRPKPVPDPPGEIADPAWFREPTRREQWLGAGLFTGFGCFFLLLYYLNSSSVFRWFILGLGIISIVRGLWHGIKAVRARKPGTKDAAGGARL